MVEYALNTVRILCSIFYILRILCFPTGPVLLLHCCSSTEILLDYWGTFCTGSLPQHAVVEYGLKAVSILFPVRRPVPHKAAKDFRMQQ